MRIGELARQAGVEVQTRTASRYRSYGPQHLEGWTLNACHPHRDA